MLSIKDAAKAVGISKQTMYRHIKNGKVSPGKMLNGEKGIETSELIRAFGELATKEDEDPENLNLELLEQENEKKLLELETKYLKKQVEELSKDKRKLVEMLEREQRTNERLLEAPKKTQSLWVRIFGRAREKQTEDA